MFWSAPQNHQRLISGSKACSWKHDYFIKISLPMSYISLIFLSCTLHPFISFSSLISVKHIFQKVPQNTTATIYFIARIIFSGKLNMPFILPLTTLSYLTFIASIRFYTTNLQWERSHKACIKVRMTDQILDNYELPFCLCLKCIVITMYD